MLCTSLRTRGHTQTFRTKFNSVLIAQWMQLNERNAKTGLVKLRIAESRWCSPGVVSLVCYNLFKRMCCFITRTASQNCSRLWICRCFSFCRCCANRRSNAPKAMSFDVWIIRQMSISLFWYCSQWQVFLESKYSTCVLVLVVVMCADHWMHKCSFPFPSALNVFSLCLPQRSSKQNRCYTG